MGLDAILFNAINSYEVVYIADFMVLISNAAFLVFVLSAFPMFMKNKQEGINYLAIFISAISVSIFFQIFFERPRPEGVLRVEKENSYSFPSTHSTTAFAWASAVSGNETYKFIFYAFAVLVAASRVYVGVHYPADVIAGAFLGVGITRLINKLYSKQNFRVKANSDTLTTRP